MSYGYDDYVRHIAQKYKLAFIISVIQTKPDNMALEDHILILRNKIKDDEIDSDFNVSICSDDFQIDDEFDKDFDYLNDANQTNDDIECINNYINTPTHVGTSTTQRLKTNLKDTNVIQYNAKNQEPFIKSKIDYHPNNNKTESNTQYLNACITESQTNAEINENNCGDKVSDINTTETHDLDNSIAKLAAFNDDDMIEANMPTNNRSLEEVLTLLNDIDNNTDILNNPFGWYSSQTQANDQVEEVQRIDDDATMCDLDNLPYVEMHRYSEVQNTNVEMTSVKSDEQTKLSLPKTGFNSQILVELDENKRNAVHNKNSTKHMDKNSSSTHNTEPNKSTHDQNKNTINNQETKHLRQYRNTTQFKNIYQNVAGLFNKEKEVLNVDMMDSTKQVNDIPEDSQETAVSMALDDFTCNTHYSESQVNEIIIIGDKYIHGTNKNSGKHIYKDETTRIDSPNKKEISFNVKYQTNQSSISENKSQKYNTISNKSTKNMSNYKNLENNDPHNKRKTVTVPENEEHHRNINNTQDIVFNNEEFTKRRKVIHIDNAGFTQESQLTNFTSLNNSSPTFEKNEELLIEENDNSIKRKDIDLSESTRNTKNKIIHIDHDLFSQQTEFNNGFTSQTNDTYTTEIALGSSRGGLINKNLHNLNTNSTNNFKDSMNINDNKKQVKRIRSSTQRKNTQRDDHKQCIKSDDKNIEQVTENIAPDYKKDFNYNKKQFPKDSLNIYNKDIPQKSAILDTTKNQRLEQNYLPSKQTTSLDIMASNNLNIYKDKGITHDNNKFKNETQNRTDSLNVYRNIKNKQKISKHLIAQNSPCTEFDDKFDKQTNQEDVDITQEYNLGSKNTERRTSLDKTLEEEICAINDNLNAILDEESHSQEAVPFKVIEELYKVKKYLNKGNETKYTGCSGDTGYRSETESRRSCKSSQTFFWLNQPAHTLINYITQYKLAMNTQDITDEISVVLGQLIDRLYDEELYPSFMEEMLDTVQLLLRNVREQICGPYSLTEKDSSIHRLVLLNKSIHIQTYTIDKITEILENIYTELSASDTVYDIENIDKLENSCYIFQLLEILLKTYKKTENLSQNKNLSQNTQEDTRLLKKSSISDIWRKKWNPNFKENLNEGSQEKVCSITKCINILNKLIIGCMENYSLVSFHALKCFNVMQN